MVGGEGRGGWELLCSKKRMEGPNEAKVFNPEGKRGLEYNLPYVPFSFEHILSDENPRFYFSPPPPTPKIIFHRTFSPEVVNTKFPTIGAVFWTQILCLTYGILILM